MKAIIWNLQILSKGVVKDCFILLMKVPLVICQFSSLFRYFLFIKIVSLYVIFYYQHYLTMIGATVAVPFILTPAMCIEETDPARSDIVSTVIFISGLVTLLQCSVGIR